MNQQALSSFIWSVADLLRGDYKQSDYGKVILPLTVLRRLDCVLEETKSKVLAEYEKRKDAGVNLEPFLLKKSGLTFYNTSPMDLKKLMGDPDNIGPNLYSYIDAFSEPVRDIFAKFDFYNQIDRLAKAKLLYLVVEKFANVDLHPDRVSNAQMGLAFEELIRKFAELSNETAGEHFTPREVIRLMVDLIFIEDDDELSKPNLVRTLYDPTAGTGAVQEKEKAFLREIIRKVNDLFDGELTDGDQLVYVNNVLKGKMLESETLAEQARNNTKQQFSNSPDLGKALTDAIIDAMDAHNTMSTQALNSDKIKRRFAGHSTGPGKTVRDAARDAAR
jgi:type I restriction enzyme M protein